MQARDLSQALGREVLGYISQAVPQCQEVLLLPEGASLADLAALSEEAGGNYPEATDPSAYLGSVAALPRLVRAVWGARDQPLGESHSEGQA